MTDLCYVIDLCDISENECFREASAQELSVLLFICEYNRRKINLDTLAELSGVSLARTKSALALFEAAGIISEVSEHAVVKDEFGDLDIKSPSVTVAKEIRDEGLRELIEECAGFMERDTLSTEEIKTITALVTDTVLTPEYVLELTAFLKSTLKAGKKLTAKKISAEAEKLIAKDIDTLEALEAYIKNKTSELHDEWEYRRALQIWPRSFTSTERSFIKTWSREYGFSVSIVTEAYDIAVLNTGGLSFPYIDRLLTDWYNAGCKTLEECKARREQKSTALKNEAEAKRPGGAKKAKESATPKYSNFNADDAMLRAIERSFGKNND